jgi:hypothetical protein
MRVSRPGRIAYPSPQPRRKDADQTTCPEAPLPLLLLFALTLFVSAALLFVLELMVGKMLLPMLGGTPAVWNTCMVFYQALLLLGYAYAHVSTAWLGVRRQAVLHLAVLLLPFLSFGLLPDRRLFDYGAGNPIPGLLLGLFLMVGLPFFVVSASAPLLQKWFSGTDHPAAKDPYFLYAASNLGSMIGLFGYPAVIEPWMTLANQRLYWQVGYVLLAVLTAACAVCLLRSQSAIRSQESGVRGQGSGVRGKEFELGKKVLDQSAREGPSSVTPDSRPLTPDPCPLTFGIRLRWVALAFVPSSLMLGATTYMTTDIAAIPLLWVLPLGLYLLSFILVFSRLPAAVHHLMVVLLPFLVLLLVFLMLSAFPLPITWKILIHLATLFVVAMVCHGELARDRPSTRHLTEFFLWMSFGGVLGGLFNALVAPVVFSGVVEYPLALVLACLLMPTLEGEKATRLGPVLGTALMGYLMGIGVALFIPALGRGDLDFRALAGTDGLWIAVALLAAVVLVFAVAPSPPPLSPAAGERGGGGRGERAARWLDLGLPAALWVLAVGLTLGLPLTAVHGGLERLFSLLHHALPDWMPARVVKLFDLSSRGILIIFIFVLPAVLCYAFVKRPLRFGLGVGALLLAGSFCELLDPDVLLRERSFFGVLHVTDVRVPEEIALRLEGPLGEQRFSSEAIVHKLEHGTTLHGQQRLSWGRATRESAGAAPLAATDPLSAAALLAAGEDVWFPRSLPQTYFHRTGPIGQVFAAYKDQLAGRHLGLIGLGSGTLASYGQPGQRLTYYEIDPLVQRVAFSPSYFTFVRDAVDRGVEVDVVLGDARLKLEERADSGPPDKFALLVVDAFSSDAIPVHLITSQAVDIYLKNLADDGILVFHISNRYLDLEPVLGNLAAEKGLVGFIENDLWAGISGKASSSWVVLARREETLNRLVHEGRWGQWQAEHGWVADWKAVQAVSALPDTAGAAHAQAIATLALFERLQAPWRRLKVRPEVGVWTDDYSNLLRVFDWKN